MMSKLKQYEIPFFSKCYLGIALISTLNLDKIDDLVIFV